MQKILPRFKKLLIHPLTKGSLIVFLGSVVGGLGNYLYHLLMGRMLGPADYGVLASLISLTYLLGVPMGTLHLVVVKFVSSLKGKKKFRAINTLFRRTTKKIFPLAVLLLLVFFLLIPLIVSFLHLDSVLPLVIVGVSFFVGTLTTVNQAALQGLLLFGYLAVSGILAVVLKVAAAVFLVTLGLKVSGGLLAIFIGGVFGYFFTLFPLRALPSARVKEERINGQEMLEFALPVFFSILSFTSLYTTDVVLVRHFLPPQQAGFYSALATLGKVIFFASSPIMTVMFPMVSEREGNGRDYKDLLFLSLGLVFLICSGITFVYWLTPSLMIKLLFGHQYLAASPYLLLFAIFLSLYSLSYLLTHFYLSIRKERAVILPMIAAVAQIALIFLYHQTLTQVIGVSIFVLGLLLVALLIYYFLDYDQGQKAFTLGHRPRL